MIPSYSDFISRNPHYKQIANDPVLEKIFNFLSEPEQIAKMIQASSEGKPALAPVVKNIESKFPNFLNLQYNSNFLKHSTGTMIKEILAPFGFSPLVPKRLPTNKIYKTAHNYSYDASNAKLKIVTTYKIDKIR